MSAVFRTGIVRTCVSPAASGAPPPADDGARPDRIRRLVAARNRLDAELAAAVRDAECHQSAEHDGLVQLRDLALASGQLPIQRTVKPHVIVTIDSDALADPATGHVAGTTGTGAVISAARARWIACDGNVAAS